MRNWLKLVKPAISDSNESHPSQTSVKWIEVDSSIALTSRNGNPLHNDKITVAQLVGVKFFKNNYNPSLICIGESVIWLISPSLSQASLSFSFGFPVRQFLLPALNLCGNFCFEFFSVDLEIKHYITSILTRLLMVKTKTTKYLSYIYIYIYTMVFLWFN